MEKLNFRIFYLGNEMGSFRVCTVSKKYMSFSLFYAFSWLCSIASYCSAVNW